MFVAVLPNGEKVNVTDSFWSKKKLETLKKEHSFVCPACRKKVQLKVGTMKIPHFAHLSSPCTADAEAESSYHLNGKKQLYRWLQKQHLKAELEKYFPLIKQRADLFTFFQQNKYAIEYQCAAISLEQVKKRTQGYQQEKIISLWILGWNQVKQVGPHIYRITPFHWQFLNPLQNKQPLIIRYCSDMNMFMLLLTPVPFTKQLVFASIARITPDFLKFHDFLTGKEFLMKPFMEQWLKKIDRYRLKPPSKTSKQERMLQKMVYEASGLSLSQLPIEAFVPLRSGFMIDEAVYIWQSYVLLFIHKLRRNEAFHVEKLVWFLKHLRINGRICPVQVDIKKPLLEYLNVLARLQILEPIGPYSFRKASSVFNLDDRKIREKRLKQYFLQEGMFCGPVE